MLDGIVDGEGAAGLGVDGPATAFVCLMFMAGLTRQRRQVTESCCLLFIYGLILICSFIALPSM